MAPLHVIAVVSNPVRYASRYRLFHEFAERMQLTPNVRLVIVEQAFGERPFVCTDPANPLHVQVRGGPESELWVKESLINIGFRHLSRVVPDWKYAGWFDADIQCLRADWAEETVHALQHYKVVQPWSRAIDMGPTGEPLGVQSIARSFVFDFLHWQNDAHKRADFDPVTFLKGAYCGRDDNGMKTFHPGFAWALTREAWERLGPLIDWVPMGSADHHMAWAFVERLDKALYHDSPGYLRRAHEFQNRCKKFLRRDIGYIDGTIVHHWHGKKKNRFYVEREKVLRDCKFDPDVDVTYNHDGLLVLTDNNPALRDAIRAYFRSRDEDSTDI